MFCAWALPVPVAFLQYEQPLYSAAHHTAPHHTAAQIESVSLLERFTSQFALGMMLADARRPVALSFRSGNAYQPGIGPFTEDKTVELVMAEVGNEFRPFQIGVPYPSNLRQRCDLCLGASGNWLLAIEFKMLRIMGDNAKPPSTELSPFEAIGDFQFQQHA